MRQSYFTLPICLVWLVVSLSDSTHAQVEAPLEKIRVVYSAGGSHNSVWIPYEAGIFRKHGLDGELLFVAGGSTTAQVVQFGFQRHIQAVFKTVGGNHATISHHRRRCPRG
jgi:hypothetical protein